MNNNQLLAFADALEERAIALGKSAEEETYNSEDEAAEYVWVTATAGATAMLISAAIRDVVKGGGRAAPGIH